MRLLALAFAGVFACAHFAAAQGVIGGAVSPPAGQLTGPLPDTAPGDLAAMRAAIPAAAKDGTDGNGITPPTGAVGIRGWLSGQYAVLGQIYSKLTGSLAVTGTFWQSVQPVSGSVSINNLPATQPVSGTVTTTPSGTQAVSIAAFPSLVAGTAAIGSVTVSNLPTTQPVSGAVSVSNTVPVTVAALPALTAGSAAIGSVSVSNLPTTQPVSGSVAISNLPTTQPVSIASLPALAAGSAAIGSVSVSNTVPVTIAALPALAAGSAAVGSVIVSNLPATQPVTIAALPALTAGSAAIGSVSVTGTTAVADSAVIAATQAILAKQPSAPALDGTDASSATAPPGAVGIRGWLSGIYTWIVGNASTSALQTAGNTSLGTIATNTATNATAGNQTTANSSLATIATNTGNGSTSAAQTTANNSLSTIAANTGAGATAANQSAAQSTLGSMLTALGNIYTKLTGSLAVTGTFWQATQPVSGAFYQASQPVADPNNATYAGVIAITPGTPVAAQREVAYLCTASGTVTLTYLDASTQTVTLPAGTYPFGEIIGAVTNVALGTASGCSFWNRK